MIEDQRNPVSHIEANLEVALVAASTILGEARSKVPNSGIASLLSRPDKIRKSLVSSESETTTGEPDESKQHEDKKGVNGPLASRNVTREGPGMSSANTLNSDTPLPIVSHFQTLLMILNIKYPSAATSNRRSPQITWPYSLFKSKSPPATPQQPIGIPPDSNGYIPSLDTCMYHPSILGYCQLFSTRYGCWPSWLALGLIMLSLTSN